MIDEAGVDDFIAAAGETPLRVAAVAIRGLQQTSRPIVERELSNLRDARTLDEVKAMLLSDWEHLQTLGVFSAVELVLDECSPVRRKKEKEFLFSSVDEAFDRHRRRLFLSFPFPSLTSTSSPLPYQTKKTLIFFFPARPGRLPRRRHLRGAAQALPQHWHLRPRHRGLRRTPRLSAQRGGARRAGHPGLRKGFEAARRGLSDGGEAQAVGAAVQYRRGVAPAL